MRRRRGAWRLAFRLAWREIRRAPGRNLLAAAMIGVPVLLIVGLSVVGRSTVGADPADVRMRDLGAADALVTVNGERPVLQDPLGNEVIADDDASPASAPDGSAGHGWSADEVAQATGGTVTALGNVETTVVETTGGAISASVRELDLRRPVTHGLLEIRRGRAPAADGEVAVSRAVLDAGFLLGDRLRLGVNDLTTVTIVGEVRDPADLHAASVVALPRSTLLAGPPTSYLVDTKGAPITWEQVRELNRRGLVVVSRAVLENPPPTSALPAAVRASGPTTDTAAYSLIFLIAVTLVLEIVLLAGPAFAVGARRAARQLALMVAAGATPRDVRRIVLAHAAVVGAATALAATALAVLVVLVTRPLIEEWVGSTFARFRVDAFDLSVVTGVAIFAALAAAWVPAVQASRRDTVAALTGRRGTRRTRRGWPVVGVLVAGCGAAAIVVGGTQAIGGEWSVALGSFALVAGMIMCLPSLVGALARAGNRLPLSLRIATRDAARNRARTVPAVAAIMGAVTGVTALAIGSSSDLAESRRDYTQAAPKGTVIVSLADGLSGEQRRSRAKLSRLVSQLEHRLPGRKAIIVRKSPSYPQEEGHRVPALVGHHCEEADPRWCGWVDPPPGETRGEIAVGSSGQIDGMLVIEPDSLARLLGKPLSGRQRAVLDAGGVLVPAESALSAGDPTTAPVATLRESDDGTAKDVHTRRLPAAVLPGTYRGREFTYLAELVATPETAKRLKLPVEATEIRIPPGTTGPDTDTEVRVEAIALRHGGRAYVERGFVETYNVQFVLLALVGGLIVVVGTATATALALSDARPDFATLAAIGASSRTRRRSAMGQAAVIGVLGVALGVVVGALPGIAATWPLTAPSPGGHIIDVPWTLLGLVAVGVPLLAVAGAGIFARSRLPMVQRID